MAREGQSLNEDVDELAFAEESENLSELEERVRATVEKLEDKVLAIRNEWRGYHPVDYDEVEKKKQALSDIARLGAKAEEVRESIASPYFAHIDLLDDSGEPLRLFIGETQLSASGEQLVIDWRSDMGGVYYNRQTTKPKVNNRTYSLLLRRTVTIEEAQLISAFTEYDSTTGELEGDVVDPFLLSVLRDKRREYKLTDIIRTIQQNQNEILRLPADESFLVQGCAGSGKTMILLHRLSYLAFNEPDVDFSKYVIVTPSEAFNEHVDALSEQLGLSRIPRYPVESFYAHLVKRMSLADTVVEEVDGKSQESFKIAVPDSVELAEGSLGNDLLKEVYSSNFVFDVRDMMARTVSQVAKRLEEANAPELFATWDADFHRDRSTPYGLYRTVLRGVRAVKTGQEVAQTDFAKTCDQLSKAKRAYENEKERVAQMRATLDQSLERVAKVAKEANEKNDCVLQEKKAALEAARAAKDDAMLRMHDTEAACNSLRERETYLQEALQSVDKPSDILSLNTELAKHLSMLCEHELRTLDQVTADLSNNATVLRAAVGNARAELFEAEEKVRAACYRELKDAILGAKSKLATLAKRISNEEERVDASAAHLKNTDEQLTRVRQSSETAKMDIQEIEQLSGNAFDPMDFLSSSSRIAHQAKEAFSADCEECKRLAGDISSAGLFAIVRKRRLEAELRKRKSDLRVSLSRFFKQTKQSLSTAIAELDGQISELQNEVAVAHQRVATAEHACQALAAEMDEQNSLIASFETKLSEGVDVSSLASKTDKAYVALSFHVADELAAYNEKTEATQRAIEDKKAADQQSNARIEHARSEPDVRVRACIDQMVQDNRDGLNKENDRLEELRANVEEAEREAKELKQTLELAEMDAAPLRDLITLVDDDESMAPDLSAYKGSLEPAVNAAVVAYESARGKLGARDLELLASAKERLEVLLNRVDILSSKKLVAEERLSSKCDPEKLDTIRAMADDIDVRVFLDGMRALLSKVYSKHGKTYDESMLYRHDLFALLVLCAWYYGGESQDVACLCIDEAQDLSLAEYQVLAQLFDGSTAINLYGDVNQLICGYRGVSDWSQLEGVLSIRHFQLSENYRNTLQVTEYCNRRFGFQTVGVGLSGEKVRRPTTIETAVKNLIRVRAAQEGARTAIIHKRGLAGVRGLLERILGDDASWGCVDDARVSVIDVETSKGLEFDAVAVIENEMNANELYIAFTRALDRLSVLTVSGLDELVVASVMTGHLEEQRKGVSDESLQKHSKEAVGQTRAQDALLSSASSNAPVAHSSEVKPEPESAQNESEEDDFDSIFEGIDDTVLKVKTY